MTIGLHAQLSFTRSDFSTIRCMDRNITAFLDHLAGERGLSENTVEAYRNDLAGLTTFIDESSICDPEAVDWDRFDEGRVADFVQHLDERGYASATRSRKIASLRSFMRFLREEGVTSDLATRRLKAPRGGKPLPKALSIEEVESLLDQVTEASTPAELRDRCGCGAALRGRSARVGGN